MTKEKKLDLKNNERIIVYSLENITGKNLNTPSWAKETLL